MPRAQPLSLLAILVCIIFAMHVTAIFLHLYWTLWWYDIILHFLGGAFIGFLILWLRFSSGYFGAQLKSSETSLLFFVLIVTLAIGIGWEVFERLLGNTWSIEGYYLDTALDIMFDLLGSISAFLYFRSKYLHHERSA
jgi:hypothetical protein